MDKKTDNKLSIESKTKKLQEFSSSAIMVIVGIISLMIGFLAIIATVYFNLAINFASEKCLFKIDNILLNIVFTSIAVCLLYLIYKILPKINKYVLLILTLAISLSLGCLWINYIQYKPISDQSMVVYCGSMLNQNNLSPILNPGSYLNRNPHQLGFCIYLMMLFRFIGKESTLVAQFLNVIYSTISAITLYFICKELFREEIVHKICLLFISFFSIYFTFFSTHIYGNIPGLMFGLISILFTLKFLENNKIINIIVVAISISLAYLLKNNFEIFAIAIIIILFLHFLQNYRKQTIASMLLILIFMFSFHKYLYHHVEKGTGYSVSEGVPMNAYIYMGIAPPVTLTPGWYTGDVEVIYNSSDYNRKEASKISNELLTERITFLLSDPIYTFKYFANKLQTTWFNPTFQVFWCSTPSIQMDVDNAYNTTIRSKPFIENILCGDLYNTSEKIMDVFQIITFLSAGFALVISFKKGNLKESLIPLIFLGGFIFHIIWETKAIYVIQYFYILLPFSAYGIYNLFKFIDNKIQKVRN